MRKLVLIAATVLALLGPTVALAEEEDPEITNQAKQHFKLGQEAFAAGKYDQAIKELKRAYVLKRIPAILMNIGMTYRKTKDYEMALYFYRKFLAEAPADDKMRQKVETEITEVEKERTEASQPAQLEPAKPAVEAAKPAIEPAKPTPAVTPAAPGATSTAPAGAPAAAVSTPAAGPGAQAAAAEPATDWAHTPIDAAPPGKPVDVRVQMPVMKGVKVKVFYRKEGQANFDQMELKRRGNEKVARLPESVASGRTFQYYVEARDAAGTLVKSSGSDSSPNIVLIDESARPQLADANGVAETNDEDEPARRVKAAPKRDIENEAVRFDIGGTDQAKAMERLRASLNKEEKAKKRKLPFGPIGWAGIATAGIGALAMLGSIAPFMLAQNDADIVSADSRCENSKNKCLFYGPNDDPTLNKAANPSTSAYDAHGRQMDRIGTIVIATGGALLAVGTGLIATDLIRRRVMEKNASSTAGKKRVAKKTGADEVDTTFYPFAGPNGFGLVSEVKF